MKLNLGCGKEPIDGFDNLDKSMGWLWESGLGMYDDASVDAITISHTLMYVKADAMDYIFLELFRVLKDGGIVRITEDATDNPRSERFGGHPECVSLTSAARTCELLARAGFKQLYLCDETITRYSDKSLLQNHHGGRPKCFFVEGVK